MNATTDPNTVEVTISLGNISLNQSSNDTDYIYEYDYSNVDFSIPPEEIVPVALLYGLTFVLGAVGNSLVIFSIGHFRRMQTVTNVFLMSLSTADLLVILICVPVKFVKWFSFTWDFGPFMCKAVHYLQNVSLICSVLTLTVISLERYYGIIHPMKAKLVCTKQKAKVVVLFVWIASAIFATPILVGQSHVLVGVRITGYWCLPRWPSPLISKLYNIGMLWLVLVIPVLLMSFSYLSICTELWLLVHRHRDQHTDGVTEQTLISQTNKTNRKKPCQFTRLRSFGNEERSRKQVIKMLITVIVLFVICWAPTLVDNILVSFNILSQLHLGALKPMRQAFVLLSYFNSCLNPMVYAFMSRHFRQTFKSALCLCVNKEVTRQTRYERHLSFTTRSSICNHSVQRTPVLAGEPHEDTVDLACGISVSTLRSHSDRTKVNSFL